MTDEAAARTDATEFEQVAREYYRALDDHDYDALAALLAPGFRHVRPDRTFEGRERFVRFMRSDRPNSDTSHPIDGVYAPMPPEAGSDDGAAAELVVRGRLLDAHGEKITGFVDVFAFDDDAVTSIHTYTA